MHKVKKNICIVFGIFVSFFMGIVIESKFKNREKDSNNDKYIKFKQYYNMLNQWIWIKHNGKSISSLFYNKGIHSIAIYGMGEIGWRLKEELDKTEISVLYGINNSLCESEDTFKIVTLEDELQQVDSIVVTPVFEFEEIYKKISSITDIPVVSLETLLFSEDV